MHPIITELNQAGQRDDIAPFEIGDTIDVHYLIVEGEKERVQVFSGIAIARSGKDINAAVTVRRMVQSEGVERVFPLHSPRLVKIEPKRRGRVHRAKLYYLRDRVGKKAVRLREDTRAKRELKK